MPATPEQIEAQLLKTAQRIEELATTVLKFPTLNTRGSDRLDFHTLPVWQIKDMLTRAYQAGFLDALVESSEQLERLCKKVDNIY